MRIYSNRGGNDIVFEFTEKKFENKVNKFKLFAPNFLRKFFKRKDKVSNVYYSYTWGFKTKEPSIYFTRTIFPPHALSINLKNVIQFAIDDMTLRHEVISQKYDDILDNSKLYYLREIVITFLYT
jgi:hypothetical protein